MHPCMNYFYFCLVPAIWAGSLICIEHVIAHVPPFFSALLRIVTALTSLWLVMRVKRSIKGTMAPKVSKVLRRKLWLTGLFSFGIPFSLLFWGEQSVSPGLAGVLNGTVPLWTFTFGALFLSGSEPFDSRKFMGVCLGLIGVVLVFWHKTATGSGAGTAAVTAMAMCYGVGVLMSRSIFTGKTPVDRLESLFHQMVSAVAYLAVVSFLFEPLPTWNALTSREVLFGTFYLGCLSTTFGFILFFRLVEHWGAVRAATTTYLIPPFALLYDYLLNGRIPGNTALVGACLIFPAVVLVQKPKTK